MRISLLAATSILFVFNGGFSIGADAPATGVVTQVVPYGTVTVHRSAQVATISPATVSAPQVRLAAPAVAPAAVKLPTRADNPVKTAAARIDALVVAGLEKAGQKPNPPANDEQLVRRLYLDIAGRIPTADESARFVRNKAPDKRATLIDLLLGSEGYKSQMFNYLADMLRVEDDYGKQTKTYLYEDWIKDQIAENRPWNDLVHDLLAAKGRLSNSGPVGYLLRDRGMPLDSLSNTLTVFLGANVACAQCHNHPLANWKQKDFYQMAAFFGATEVATGKGMKKVKQLRGTIDKKTLTRLLAPNLADVEDMHSNTLTFPQDYKYDDEKAGSAVPPKLIAWSKEDENNPAYKLDMSNPEALREQFANWLTHRDNPRFATAIANRLWKRAFGLAVQEPVTDLDDLTKASNPELLAELTAEMKQVKFDLKAFQRVVYNTQAYQRQVSVTPDLGKGPYLFPGPLLRRMTAEQAWDSVLTLVVGPAVDNFKLRRAEEVRRLNIPGAAITVEAIMNKVHELQAESAAEGKRMLGKTAKSGKNGGGSEVTAHEYEGTPPPMFEGLTLARASELPQPAKEAHFLRMFGQSDRQIADGSSLEGGVPQVLMMMNGDVQKCIASESSRVLQDAARQGSPELKVESLYFSFLGRRPTLPERQSAAETLASGLKLTDLTWVLFNSREFIFIQ